MPKDRSELLQGTLDLLVLKALALAPGHGWAVSQRIQQLSRDALRVNQGSLYPALQRLERDGFIDSEMGVADNNRRVKVYRLTASGRRQLAAEVEVWERFAGAVGLVLVAT
jgi:PadR family transcriptional regulator, regulatory protein PadR